MNQCPICCREAHSPYRAFDKVTGRILAGCVDKFHTGHLVTPSASADWHNRKQAKVIRRNLAKFGAGVAAENERAVVNG